MKVFNDPFFINYFFVYSYWIQKCLLKLTTTQLTSFWAKKNSSSFFFLVETFRSGSAKISLDLLWSISNLHSGNGNFHLSAQNKIRRSNDSTKPFYFAFSLLHYLIIFKFLRFSFFSWVNVGVPYYWLLKFK